MAELAPRTPSVARLIFASHFERTMEDHDLARAMRIFDEVGAHNERSIALQLHAAQAVGKLEAVLTAYEAIMDPEQSSLHLLPEIPKAVHVRMFGDYVYGAVIANGDPNTLMELRGQITVPKAFDAMDPPFDITGMVLN